MRTSSLFGDRAFYKRALAVSVPIMIQNGISNFVSLLDNVMVGRLGTEQMSGVAVANQLVFIFNLFIFGAISGAGIFTAQFFGSGDHKGVRGTFRFKLLTCAAISLLTVGGFSIFGRELISLFLSDDASGDIALTLNCGAEYMMVMLFGLLPFALTQSYAGTLRECGDTKLPMIAGIFAVCTNLLFNYILIFGKLGAPALGVTGAAAATVISRFVELGIIIVFTHGRLKIYPYLKGLYKSLHIPAAISRDIIRRGTPLMFNELLWALGISAMVQCYSTRGLAVVAGINIANTITNLFTVVFFALGNAIAIVIGQELGANDPEKAKLDSGRMITFAVLVSVIVGVIMAVLSPYIPMIYNTNAQVRSIATSLLLCSALSMPFISLSHSCYFTLRSGGKTLITFLFDSCFMWTVCVPVSFILSRLTDLPIIPLYLICQMLEIIKCTAGAILVKKGIWLNNIVNDKRQTVEELPAAEQ